MDLLAQKEIYFLSCSRVFIMFYSEFISSVCSEEADGRRIGVRTHQNVNAATSMLNNVTLILNSVLDTTDVFVIFLD